MLAFIGFLVVAFFLIKWIGFATLVGVGVWGLIGFIFLLALGFIIGLVLLVTIPFRKSK